MGYILRVKRIYLPKESSDGIRILVDRLWPRGVSKERASLDFWAKEVTPSPQLRKWFGHKAENFDNFKESYISELDHNEEARIFAQKCKGWLNDSNVTLLYAAKDTVHNHAVILEKWLQDKLTS